MSDPLSPDDGSQVWYQPLLFYAIALALRVLPFGESSVRLVTVLIAFLNIGLIYLVARHLFDRPAIALVSALMLALTPAHLIMSRQALDYICPLPFALGWMWCLTAFRETGRPSLMAAGGLLLGLGLFSYVAAWALMPIFLTITILLLWRYLPARLTAIPAVCIGLVAPLLLATPWLLAHPEAIAQTFNRYNVGSSPSYSPTAMFANLWAADIGRRASLYWDYFNPSFLFFAGGADPTQSTSGWASSSYR